MKFVATYSSHLERYVFALPHCYKRRVLDVGSKDGDCSIILSYGASELSLCDINEAWLNASKKKSYLCPVKNFFLTDLEKEFPEGKWEVITAFEIIEHVIDPEFLVKNVADHLEDDGRLVFSVPHMIDNKEHKTLFDEEKIKNLVSKYFEIEKFYVQEKKVISGEPMYKGLKCYVGVARKKHG